MWGYCTSYFEKSGDFDQILLWGSFLGGDHVLLAFLIVATYLWLACVEKDSEKQIVNSL